MKSKSYPSRGSNIFPNNCVYCGHSPSVEWTTEDGIRLARVHCVICKTSTVKRKKVGDALREWNKEIFEIDKK